MKFLHKKTGRIVDLPEHFKDAKVAKNFTPLNDDFEEETDKVIISHAPNSLQRVGRKIKEKTFDDFNETPPSEDEN